MASASLQCKGHSHITRWLQDMSSQHDWLKFGELRLFVTPAVPQKKAGPVVFSHLGRRTTSFLNLIGQEILGL